MAADRLRTRGSVRTAVVWRSVRSLLVDLVDGTGRNQLDVLDAGGGTGGFAVPLAELGHHVTVVDASPDSLAALVRRAADAGVTDRIKQRSGRRGEPARRRCGRLVRPRPAAQRARDRRRSRPRRSRRWVGSCGLAAWSASSRRTGSPRCCTALLPGVSMRRCTPCVIRSGGIRQRDPAPRRFALTDLEALLAAAGLTVIATHGSRVFADLIPGGSLDADPAAVEALIALEFEASEVPAFRDIATQLHVVGRRS